MKETTEIHKKLEAEIKVDGSRCKQRLEAEIKLDGSRCKPRLEAEIKFDGSRCKRRLEAEINDDGSRCKQRKEKTRYVVSKTALDRKRAYHDRVGCKGERQNGTGQDVACRRPVCSYDFRRHIVPSPFCGDARHPVGEPGKQRRADGTKGMKDLKRRPIKFGIQDQRGSRDGENTDHKLNVKSEQEHQLGAKVNVGRKANRG